MSGPPAPARRCSPAACRESCPARPERGAGGGPGQEPASATSRATSPLDWSRPFRAPHHGVSMAGLIGGGAGSRCPGEISRSQPRCAVPRRAGGVPDHGAAGAATTLETGRVTITRSRGSVTYPARFALVAATNPCPAAGRRPHPGLPLHARSDRRLPPRLSGPLVDRIDLQVAVQQGPRCEALGRGAARRAVVNRSREGRRGARTPARPAGLPQRPAASPSGSAQLAALSRSAPDAGALVGAARHVGARLPPCLARGAQRPPTSAAEDEIAERHVLEALGFRLQDVAA